MQHDEQVTVRLRAVSGDVIWGPGAIAGGAAVDELRRCAARALRRPAACVRLLHGDAVLEPQDTLSAAGVRDGAELGVVLLCLDTEVRQILRKLREAVYVTIRDDVERVPVVEVPNKLAEVASACGCDALPEDVATWLQVIFACGKTIKDNCEQRYELDEGCTVSGGSIAAGSHKHGHGLLYLAVDCFDEMFMGCSHWGCVVVDLRGELAEVLGERTDGAAGAVWYSKLQWDSGSPEVDPSGVPSLRTWRQLLDDGRLTGRAAPRRIATDTTEFFRLWAHRGRPPQFEVRRVPRIEEPEGPPRCSA